MIFDGIRRNTLDNELRNGQQRHFRRDIQRSATA
jgi:hypothetical protein